MENKQSKSISEQILIEVSYLLNPLKRINPQNVFGLFNDLGYKLPTSDLFQNGFPDLVTDIENLISKVDVIQEASGSDDYMPLLLELQDSTQSVISLITKANGIRSKIKTELVSFPDFLNNSGIASDEFPIRLFDYLLFLYLQTRQPQIFSILYLIGIVEQEEFTATGDWEPVGAGLKYSVRRVQWERIADLFTNPKGLVDDVYSWSSDFEGDKFLHRMEILLKAFLIPGGIYKQNKALRDYFDRDPGSEEIRLPLYQDGQWPSNYKEFDLNLCPIPSKNGDKSGLALYPYILREVDITADISDAWSFTLKGNTDMEGGIGLQIRPPAKLHMDTSIFDSPDDFIDAHFEIGIMRKTPRDKLTYIFGSEDGSYLGYGEIGFNLILALENSKEEFAAEMLINDLSLMIDMSKGDGFIQKLLSGIKMESVSDLTIGISNKDGFYFLGSSALAIEIPIHKSLGPISINTITIGVGFDEKIKVILAVSFSFELGPIIGAVDGIGLEIPFSISSDNSGNFGPLQIDGIQFKPPTGVGMLVDADVVTGGGFIEFDRINERYAGILQLSFGEIGLTAIGLITTRMPDGSPGFSMLISVSVEFSPEIQITMGFTLSAVGGLIGINRTMDLAALEKRFRNRALDSILFPKDPILNASKIISDLRAVFPPKENRYVIGAMVAIGYGNPNIIRGEIGIFIEIPEPIRASIMGQISAILPEEDNPIVVLNLDVLGIIRPSKKKITIDSVLYDSRILYLNLFGDAAIWLKWGKNPQFIMSLGGFHPKFTPPPGFPKLQRLTLALNWGNTLFMLFQFYMAITPNSLQFGTKFDITIKCGKAVITGGMSFDALFYFSPFLFEVDITGYVVAKAFGKELSNIRLYFNLSGPTPWHAIGSAKFKILFVKFKVDFDIIKGPIRTIDPISAVDPWIPLKEALERRQAWSSSLPPTSNMVESLRPIDEPKDVKDKKSMPFLVHPAGKLEVRQNVLPFEVTLDKFGNAPVINHNKFSLKSVSSGKIELKCTHVNEYFAKKPFKNLTFKEQLSSESYELQQAGIEITSEAIKVPGKMKAKSLEYENILINDDGTSEKEKKRGRLSWEVGMRQTKMNAAGQSPIRRKGHRAFEIRDKEPGIQVNEEKYRIVFNSNMKSVPALKHFIPNYQEDMKRSEAEAALGKYLRQHPENLGEVQIVNSYEVSV